MATNLKTRIKAIEKAIPSPKTGAAQVAIYRPSEIYKRAKELAEGVNLPADLAERINALAVIYLPANGREDGTPCQPA